MQSLPVKPKQPHCESPKGTSLSHYNDGKQNSHHCEPAGRGNPVYKSPHNHEQPSRHNARDKGFQHTQNSNELTTSNTSYFPSNDMEKAAFTLAEVLITLGIIGIVAAMTLPTLITNHQKKVLVISLKKNFNIISQSILKSQANIEDPEWSKDIDNSVDFSHETIAYTARKYIVNDLKLTKDWGVICPALNSSFPKYKTLDGVQANPTSTTGTVYYTVELANGTFLFYKLGANSDGTTTSPFMYIDVNGRTKPNIVGKDIFMLIINPKGQLQMPGINQSRNQLLELCKRNASAASIYTSCGALIQKDNWEIKNDYPW